MAQPQTAHIDVTSKPMNSKTSIYLVVVHGLNGNCKSFVNENGTSLQQLLSISIPTATILTYSYPNRRMKGFGGSHPFESIQERAHNFLHLLAPYIESDIISTWAYKDCVHDNQKSDAIRVAESKQEEHQLQREPEPIIFICHSMGGLLVKSAMEIASNPYCSDEIIHGIYRRAKGFVFYATPHCGSAVANLYEAFANKLPYLGPSAAVLNLKQNGRFLLSLQHRFNNLVANHPVYSTVKGRKCILCLCEGQGEPALGYRKIVDKSSSSTYSPHEILVPVDYYHTIICQPAGFSDTRFVKLAHFLKQYLMIPINDEVANPKKTASIDVNRLIPGKKMVKQEFMARLREAKPIKSLQVENKFLGLGFHVVVLFYFGQQPMREDDMVLSMELIPESGTGLLGGNTFLRVLYQEYGAFTNYQKYPERKVHEKTYAEILSFATQYTAKHDRFSYTANNCRHFTEAVSKFMHVPFLGGDSLFN